MEKKKSQFEKNTKKVTDNGSLLLAPFGQLPRVTLENGGSTRQKKIKSYLLQLAFILVTLIAS